MKNHKILAFLIVLLWSTFISDIYAQKSISVHLTKVPLSQVIKELESKTDYTFFINDTRVDVNTQVSVSVNNVSLDQALKSTFASTEYTYEIIGKQILIKIKNTLHRTAEKVVTGVVTDAKGEPVIGVSVSQKGTSNATMTDINGNYSLRVPEKADIQITYIGYITQVFKVDKVPHTITLQEDNLLLDEVVVVGYGVAKKKDLTGAVVRADLTKLQDSPNINIASSLQGLVPGLNVGAVNQAGQNPSISIRGRTSISGSTSPLLVLDGIIYRGSLVDINPSDIESIDVLKDASAAAIYGSEASNGVILLTTKQGGVMDKPVIEYSGSFTYQEASKLNKMKPGNRNDFLRKIGDRFLSESRIGDDMLQPNPAWNPVKYLMDNNAINGYNNGTDTDWYDLLTNGTPYIQNHNLSLRGKSSLSNYYFSIGYTDQKNLIINDTYQRYNIRINLDTKVRDWLKIGTQSFFSTGNSSGISPSIYTVMILPPLITPWDESGELIKEPYKYFGNPLLAIKQPNEKKRYNIMGNFYADISFPFFKGLNYRLNTSQNLVFDKNFNYNPQGANFQGEGIKINASQYNWTIDNILSYNRNFRKHAVNATFVYGVEERKNESTEAGAKIFSNGVLGYNQLQSGQADQQWASSTAWKESSLYTMFRIGYTYNGKYIFTGTVRRDGFSGFGENHKFGTFPSAAIAWRINEEDFMEKQKNWLDNLKLRLAYGVNGNRSLDRYQTMAKLENQVGYLYGDKATPEQMQWISSLANIDLKWETTNSLNIGIDYSLFRGRLFGDMEYYTSHTNNLLYDINIPNINGLNSVSSNIGKMGNHGFEFTATGIPVKTKDFSWSITFAYSINRNKVIKILGIDSDGDGKEDDLIANKIFINKPYGVAYDYNITGMWQIADKIAGNIPTGFDIGTYKVEDINLDEKFDAKNDRKIIGYTDPSYRFSIQNTLGYKNWNFKFFINSIQGGKNRYLGQPAQSIPNPDNIYQQNIFNFDYWTPENPNARYRQIGYYPPVLGESFSPYIKRSFVRLQDITLSYNFSSKALKKTGINRLKLFLTGKNLLTITKWDGWDPEMGDGLSLSAFPLMKSYSAGLNLEF